MIQFVPLRLIVTLLLASIAGLAASAAEAPSNKLRVLVLSGANNHKWQETSPAIKETLEASGRFAVDIENNVPGMNAGSFAPYAVILGNFNTFGSNAPAQVWDAATRKGFLDHMANSHGLVIVHAGSSVFYDWPEFQKLACGSWGAATKHGPISIAQVTFTETNNPITAGLKPFWIRDEFWELTQLAPGTTPLAAVTLTAADGKHEIVLFTNESGGGRGFAMFLGHDASVMKNTAWRSLLQRGTEWAATGKVTIPPAQDWPATQTDAQRMSPP